MTSVLLYVELMKGEVTFLGDFLMSDDITCF